MPSALVAGKAIETLDCLIEEIERVKSDLRTVATSEVGRIANIDIDGLQWRLKDIISDLMYVMLDCNDLRNKYGKA